MSILFQSVNRKNNKFYYPGRLIINSFILSLPLNTYIYFMRSVSKKSFTIFAMFKKIIKFFLKKCKTYMLSWVPCSVNKISLYYPDLFSCDEQKINIFYLMDFGLLEFETDNTTILKYLIFGSNAQISMKLYIQNYRNIFVIQFWLRTFKRKCTSMINY